MISAQVCFTVIQKKHQHNTSCWWPVGMYKVLQVVQKTWYHLRCGMSRHPFIMSWSNRPSKTCQLGIWCWQFWTHYFVAPVWHIFLSGLLMNHNEGQTWGISKSSRILWRPTIYPSDPSLMQKLSKNLKSPDATLSFTGTFQSPSSLPSLYSLKIGSLLKSPKGPALAPPCHWNYGSAKTAKNPQRGSTGIRWLGKFRDAWSHQNNGSVEEPNTCWEATRPRMEASFKFGGVISPMECLWSLNGSKLQ